MNLIDNELSAEVVTDSKKEEYEGDVMMKSRLADSDKLSFFPLAIDDYFMAIAVLAKKISKEVSIKFNVYTYYIIIHM